MFDDPRTPAEKEERLLCLFRCLDEVGQNLALVILHTIAGNPAMRAAKPDLTDTQPTEPSPAP